MPKIKNAPGEPPFDFKAFSEERSQLFSVMYFIDIQWFYVHSKKLKNRLRSMCYRKQDKEKKRNVVTLDLSLTPVSGSSSVKVTVVYGRGVSNDEYTIYRLMGMVVLQALKLPKKQQKKLINPLAKEVGLSYREDGVCYLIYTVAVEFLFFLKPAEVMALCVYHGRLVEQLFSDHGVVNFGDYVTRALRTQKTSEGMSVEEWLAQADAVGNVKAHVGRLLYKLPLKRKKPRCDLQSMVHSLENQLNSIRVDLDCFESKIEDMGQRYAELMFQRQELENDALCDMGGESDLYL